MNRIHNMSYAKRILAWVLAVTVVLSILTIPQGESYAAAGTVKSIAEKRKNIYLEIKGNRNRKSFKEGYL